MGTMVVVLKQERSVLWLREKLKMEVKTSVSVGTCSEGLPWDVVRSSCFAGVNFAQSSVYKA